MASGVLGGALAAAVSGCAVGPNFSPAPAPDINGYLPEKLASPSSGPGGPRVASQHFTGADISARWWAAFQSQSLNDLIKQSVDHNPSLQVAEPAIKVAYYNALAQRGLFFPQVTGNSTTSQILMSNAGSVFGADLDSVPQTGYSLVTHQLTISFVPDVWGANFRAVENLDAVTEQQMFQLEAAYLALTSNVVTAAIQEASLCGQIAATQRAIAIERRLLGILNRQHDLGQVAQADVLAQEAALAQTEELSSATRKAAGPAAQPLDRACRTTVGRRDHAEIRSSTSQAARKPAHQPAQQARRSAA
jgi:outer membrane protein TolC